MSPLVLLLLLAAVAFFFVPVKWLLGVALVWLAWHFKAQIPRAARAVRSAATRIRRAPSYRG